MFCRLAPNRGFTSYLYICVVGSKPRTYSSVGSTDAGAPHPCRLFEPCSSASRPVSGLLIPMEIVARSGSFPAPGVMAMRPAIDIDHGPSQLPRPAMKPICFVRQLRTELDELAIRLFMPATSDESPAIAGFDGL